jgi:hypothetical protein
MLLKDYKVNDLMKSILWRLVISLTILAFVAIEGGGF